VQKGNLDLFFKRDGCCLKKEYVPSQGLLTTKQMRNTHVVAQKDTNTRSAGSQHLGG
jgi:hypothetical protein